MHHTGFMNQAAPQVAPVAKPTASNRAATLRAFNRFYTRRIGVLQDRLLESSFSLPESRVLWELAHTPGLTASGLAEALQLDAGYLSRLLASLRDRKLLKAERAAHDGRQTLLSLTPSGQRALAPLEQRAQAQMGALLAPLTEGEQQELLYAAQRIESLLDRHQKGAVRLRGLRPGDVGWMISRHAALYAQEYGWDGRFEAMVARIGADYIDHLDPRRECAWIAERVAAPLTTTQANGEMTDAGGPPLGCVFLVQAQDETRGQPEPGVAQLRLLIVEPAARGLGIGKQLVGECTRFAREAGYERIRLWTNSILTAARTLYAQAGYQLIASEPHESFGQRLVGETWELRL
ncbi:transcriptional regulator, MarR family with acetyltransferase activity [Hylemonella gracilis ATCC 19624]|uniref:Transcriptional regulator, MarR family with acetyltransferase activity n=2 Tax=Hylemonella gracilis TaxID=80880 RepID=F3KXH4_9BURK|nr:transcriptional regulator, MarR family with acetyltransferase activity [Hylemonella gracilis ATCC 19624]